MAAGECQTSNRKDYDEVSSDGTFLGTLAMSMMDLTAPKNHPYDCV
jgi:hypothetical protein